MREQTELEQLRKSLVVELLEQGASLDTTAIVATGLNSIESMEMMMDYLISIRKKTVKSFYLILKAREIRESLRDKTKGNQNEL